MARQPNPLRKSSPSMLLKTTKNRLDKHRKPLSELPKITEGKTRSGNESDDQLINRILDTYEKTFPPNAVGLSTYGKPVVDSAPQTTQ